MQFSIPKILIAALGLSNVINAALTPAQIVVNIRTITVKSQNLQVTAKSITVLDAVLFVVGGGQIPKVITGFGDIVATTTASITQMQGTPRVTAAADVKAIADAFRVFVQVHQALLNILIGKAGLFRAVPLIGQPVALVLSQIERVVDTIAYSLIDITEGTATDILDQTQSLDVTIINAMDAYDGL
ncbi:hypothetical protein KJ359_000193 [Pestalotiopsis sp. 9143b]|nr:hypothetical protein KJ359_000193 [Pestalotiopsis sp. 9143b]